MTSFFSQIDITWAQYEGYRTAYANGIPIPQSRYFKPISDINDFASTIIRPIDQTLWLAFHTLGFVVKCICSFVATILLAPCALIMSIVSPKSTLSDDTNKYFKLMFANTLVSLGMAALALLATCLSPILNSLFVITRGCATVVDHLNAVTESRCGVSIVKL